MVTAAVLSIWATAIALSDITRFRVPNLYLLLVAVPALLVQVWASKGFLGVSWADALGGMGVGFGLTWAGYAVGQVGAGDVKYAALIGFLAGTRALLDILLIAALVIGAMSLAALLYSKLRQASMPKVPAAVALSAGLIANLAGR